MSPPRASASQTAKEHASCAPGALAQPRPRVVLEHPQGPGDAAGPLPVLCCRTHRSGGPTGTRLAVVARIQALTVQMASPSHGSCCPVSASRQSGISTLSVVFSWSSCVAVSGPACAELSCLCPLTWGASRRRECRLPIGSGFARGTWLEVMLGHPRAGSLEAVGVSSPGLVPVLHQPLQAGPDGPADRVFRAQAAMESQGGLCLQEKLPH